MFITTTLSAAVYLLIAAIFIPYRVCHISSSEKDSDSCPVSDTYNIYRYSQMEGRVVEPMETQTAVMNITDESASAAGAGDSSSLRETGETSVEAEPKMKDDNSQLGPEVPQRPVDGTTGNSPEAMDHSPEVSTESKPPATDGETVEKTEDHEKEPKGEKSDDPKKGEIIEKTENDPKTESKGEKTEEDSEKGSKGEDNQPEPDPTEEGKSQDTSDQGNKPQDGASKAPMKKQDSEMMRKMEYSEKKRKLQDDSEPKIKEEEEEEYTFPSSLEEFGFHFNENGELRSIEKEEPFEFRAKEDMTYNQKRYEALGEIITQHIYSLLESETKLERITIPIDAKEGEATSFFFASLGAWEKEKVLIIIHGSGVVRAGQWTRKLIINNDLDKGTQLPYIRWGLENDFGVVVLNSNHNYVDDSNYSFAENHANKIRGSESPEEHALYVWKTFLMKEEIKHVAIVAHSYGGILATYLAYELEEDFCKRVFAVAFTDSVHSLAYSDFSRKVKDFFQKNAVNWVSSNKPRDEEMPMHNKKDAKRVSAGHEKHEWTSFAAMKSVFLFIKDKQEHIKQHSFSECTSL